MIRLGPIAGLVIVAVVAVIIARSVRRLEDVLGLVLAAGALAVLTQPVNAWLQRVVGGLAVAFTAIVSLTTTLAGGFIVLRSLRSQATAIAESVTERIAEIGPGTTAGRVIDSLRIESAIEAWLARVPDLVIVGESSGAGIGRQLIALVTVVILAAFLQASGTHVIDWFTSLWPRSSGPADRSESSPRENVRELLIEIDVRAIGAVRRLLLLAFAVTVIVASNCSLLGVSGSILLGIWAGVWFVVPTIGWVVGIAPLGLLVWLDRGLNEWIAIVIGLAVATATTLVRRRFIDRETVHLGVGPYVIGTAVGVSMGGVVGSVLGLIAAAVVCVIVTSERSVSAPQPWTVAPEAARTVAGFTVPTGWRGALVAIGAAGAGVVIWIGLARIAPAIVWLLIGAFVAVALSRPVGWLERRVPHRVATGVVLTMIVGAALLITATAAREGGQATSVADRLPAVVDDLEDSPVIGGWLADHDAAVWVGDQVNDLPQRVRTLRPAEWLPAVGARMIDLFWTALIGVALLIDGRRIVRSFTAQIPATHRRQFSRLVEAIGTALGGYAAGATLVAGINGGVVFAIAVTLGIALAPILAAWAFVWNFVPQIGGFIGGVPLILFALLAGPAQALIASAVFVVYQFVENNLIQPTVIGAAIDVPPWGTLVAALAGGAAAGVIGAIVVTPLVGVIRVVRRELGRADFPGATVNGAAREVAPSPHGSAI